MNADHYIVYKCITSPSIYHWTTQLRMAVYNLMAAELLHQVSCTEGIAACWTWSSVSCHFWQLWHLPCRMTMPCLTNSCLLNWPCQMKCVLFFRVFIIIVNIWLLNFSVSCHSWWSQHISVFYDKNCTPNTTITLQHKCIFSNSSSIQYHTLRKLYIG